MSPAWLAGIAAAAWLMSLLSATAARSLHALSVHELEELCLLRGRMGLFRFIVEHRERLTQGAESMRAIATVIAVSSFALFQCASHAGNGPDWSSWLSVVSLAALAMLASNSWIPHAVSEHAGVVFLYWSWRLWWAVAILTWPMIVFSELVARVMGRATGGDPDADDEEEQLEEEIRSMVSEGEREGLLESDERSMIEGVMELDEKDVCSVMTPRSRLDALDAATSWDEAVRFVVASGRTRVPVYTERLDQIDGILLAKDLLKESLLPPQRRRPLKRLLRRALFVPESTMLDEMLQQFLQQRTHMAIIRDEYGGVAGLVTIEDILEEIVGEIVDETDDEQPVEFSVLAPGSVRVDGIVRIDMINDRLGTELPEEEDFDTIAGLVLSRLRAVPLPGTELQEDNVRIRVLSATPRAVQKVQLSVVSDDARHDRPVDVTRSGGPDRQTS